MKFKVERTDGQDNTGKNYLVVNVDEPYAGQVADLIEAEERRKGTWEHGNKTMREIMGILDVKNKNLFRLNDDGIAEWVVAESKQQAFIFADTMWGGIGKDEYLKEYLEDNPDANLEDFIDYFVTLEDPKKLHTYHKDNGDRETKTIKEWLEDVKEVPSYFGCSEY